MADEKKAPKDINLLEETVFLLAGLLLLGVILGRFYYYIRSISATAGMSAREYMLGFFGEFWPVWKVVALVISILSVFWLYYSYRRLHEIEEEEKNIFGAPLPESAGALEEEKKKNDKWERVKMHGNSQSPADWRLAILEADIMLDEALRAKGLPGDGVGEMLKSLDKSDLLTLEHAWDAHKVRNRIAHSGGDFQLTDRETKRVIALFEAVFKELGII